MIYKDSYFSFHFKMFIILLCFVFGATAVQLINFEHIQIEFDPTCKEFFLFNGSTDYAYFHQRNGKFELWLTQNSSNYAVYTMENSSTLLFEWNGTTAQINGNTMIPILKEGTFNYPLRFNYEQYQCPILSIDTHNGIDQRVEPEPLSYKCKPPSKLVLICTITTSISVVSLLLLYIRNESVKAVLGSAISWFLQWRRQILYSSKESLPKSDEEKSFASSEQIGSLYITQEIYSTEKISENLDTCAKRPVANRSTRSSEV